MSKDCKVEEMRKMLHMFLKVWHWVQHQQMEPHNHISITPFPFSLLSHAMLLLHVKKQSQIALDAHLFPIPVTWQWTGPAGLSPQQGIGCYQWLRFGGAPFLTRPLPWPRNFHYCTKAWMLLAMSQECYGMLQKWGHFAGTLAMRVKSNHAQPTHTPCRITKV